MPDPTNTRGEAFREAVQRTLSGEAFEPTKYHGMWLVDFLIVTTLAVAACGAAMTAA